MKIINLENSLRWELWAQKWSKKARGCTVCCIIRQRSLPHGGDLDSTWVAKPEVHAELQTTRKTDCKTLVANDDNYALAA